MPSLGPKWRTLRRSPSNSRRLIPMGSRYPTQTAWSGASVRYVTLSCSNPSAVLNCRQRPFSSRLTPAEVLTHTRPRLSARIARMIFAFSPGSWTCSNRHPSPRCGFPGKVRSPCRPRAVPRHRRPDYRPSRSRARMRRRNARLFRCAGPGGIPRPAPFRSTMCRPAPEPPPGSRRPLGAGVSSGCHRRRSAKEATDAGLGGRPERSRGRSRQSDQTTSWLKPSDSVHVSALL